MSLTVPTTKAIFMGLQSSICRDLALPKQLTIMQPKCDEQAGKMLCGMRTFQRVSPQVHHARGNRNSESRHLLETGLSFFDLVTKGGANLLPSNMSSNHASHQYTYYCTGVMPQVLPRAVTRTSIHESCST